MCSTRGVDSSEVTSRASRNRRHRRRFLLLLVVSAVVPIALAVTLVAVPKRDIAPPDTVYRCEVTQEGAAYREAAKQPLRSVGDRYVSRDADCAPGDRRLSAGPVPSPSGT